MPSTSVEQDDLDSMGRGSRGVRRPLRPARAITPTPPASTAFVGGLRAVYAAETPLDRSPDAGGRKYSAEMHADGK